MVNELLVRLNLVEHKGVLVFLDDLELLKDLNVDMAITLREAVGFFAARELKSILESV